MDVFPNPAPSSPKGGAPCDRCAKEERAEDKPCLRAIQKRRAVEQMELDKGAKRNKIKDRKDKTGEHAYPEF